MMTSCDKRCQGNGRSVISGRSRKKNGGQVALSTGRILDKADKMWPRFGDMVVIYTLLTPLCVMYWHATYSLLDRYLNNNLQSALVGGYTVVVLSILLNETLRCVGEAFQYKCIFEYIYDYIVFTACLCYVHGCKILYDALRTSLPALGIALIVSLFLIMVRGYRNIVALPAVVNNDALMDRYRPQSTLIFFGNVPGTLYRLYAYMQRVPKK